MNNVVRKDKVKEFVLGGKAHFTAHNLTTDNQRKYLVQAEYLLYGRVVKQRPPEDRPYTIVHYVVYNADQRKMRYIGRIDGPTLVYNPDYKYHRQEAAEFAWLYKLISTNNLPTNLLILHHGSCSVCGRPLTDAESLETGIGPICLKRIQQYNSLK
jgi:hypothetical protein